MGVLAPGAGGPGGGGGLGAAFCWLRPYAPLNLASGWGPLLQRRHWRCSLGWHPPPTPKETRGGILPQDPPTQAAASHPPPLPPNPADTCSNSIRVVKTTKQTATTPLTYPQAIRVGGTPLPLLGVAMTASGAAATRTGWEPPPALARETQGP